MDIMISIILIILSYLYGSIPFALVIGRLVYKTDVRNYGSGNLGGTNTGRVLGKKAGVAVILLDASKALLVMLLTILFLQISKAVKQFQLQSVFLWLSIL